MMKKIPRIVKIWVNFYNKAVLINFDRRMINFIVKNLRCKFKFAEIILHFIQLFFIAYYLINQNLYKDS